MNNYENILSLVSQADAPLEDILKKQSELGTDAETLTQTLGGALIHGGTTNLIAHLKERVGKVKDDIVKGVKDKLAEVKDKVMDKITDARNEGQAKFNEVVNSIKPEATETELNPAMSYLRDLQTPHNFSGDNMTTTPYSDEDVERGIRQTSPELSESDIQTGVNILNNNETYAEQTGATSSPETIEAERLLQRQKIGKIGKEAQDMEDIERHIDNRPRLLNVKDDILQGLKSDEDFQALYNRNTVGKPKITLEQAGKGRQEILEKYRNAGKRLREADEPLADEDLLPEGAGSVAPDADIRRLTGQPVPTEETPEPTEETAQPTEPLRPAVAEEAQATRISSGLDDPVAQNTTEALRATDELRGGSMATQRTIQQQMNELSRVPVGERPADLPFLQRQTIADIPEQPPVSIPTRAITSPLEGDLSQATKTAMSKVQSEAGDVATSVSKTLEEKAGSIGTKLGELAEESTVADDTGVGDIVTLGLGLASLFTGGLFHHAPKVQQPLVSQLLNPSFQMGINE